MSVILMTSNGGGMGHLTRMRALALALRDRNVPVSIFSLSYGAYLLEDEGFQVDYMPSHESLGIRDWQPWQVYLFDRLQLYRKRTEAKVLVFDGAHPYDGLRTLFHTEPDLFTVWSYRGLFRRGASRAALDKADWFDAVVEPLDRAESYDEGPTKSFRGATHRIAPLTSEVDCDVSAVRSELGLAEGEKAALVQLGAGNINDIQSHARRAVRHLAAAGYRVYFARSPISMGELEVPDARVVSLFPLASRLGVFELAVSAAGYSTFHELCAAAVPTLYIPNRQTILDDQVARARWANDNGLAVMLGEDDALEEALDRLIAEREPMVQRLGASSPSNGAEEFADLVTGWAR